jgi:hypothetical protein
LSTYLTLEISDRASARGRNGIFTPTLIEIWSDYLDRFAIDISSKRAGDTPPLVLKLGRTDMLVLAQRLRRPDGASHPPADPVKAVARGRNEWFAVAALTVSAQPLPCPLHGLWPAGGGEPRRALRAPGRLPPARVAPLMAGQPLAAIGDTPPLPDGQRWFRALDAAGRPRSAWHCGRLSRRYWLVREPARCGFGQQGAVDDDRQQTALVLGLETEAICPACLDAARRSAARRRVLAAKRLVDSERGAPKVGR